MKRLSVISLLSFFLSVVITFQLILELLEKRHYQDFLSGAFFVILLIYVGCLIMKRKDFLEKE